MTDQKPSHHTEPITRANEFIEAELRRRLEDIEKTRSAHALSFSGPLVPGVDDAVRDLIETHREKSDASTKLVVLITTLGGQIGPVQRMVETIRHFYDHVSFVVPNYAYSAGTIFCMSGDDIYMDYYSRLGPIDPQVPGKNGPFVPALGYLRQWEAMRAREERGELTTAELHVMLNFDQAELYMYDQARKQSIALLEEWLAKYKFKNWSETRDRKIQVTPEMKTQRAGEVATILNDTDQWHSHGHGISMEVLERSVGLEIDDLADHPGFYTQIKHYDQLMVDYTRRLGVNLAVQMTTSPLVAATI